MSWSGRETSEFLTLARRGVVALEKLNENLAKLDQEVQVDVDHGPPICPHCGTDNPQVEVSEESSTGPLSEYVIEARCMECDEILYIVVESYSMHRTLDTVRDELSSKRGGRNG